MASRTAIGIDLGGTWLRVGVVDEHGRCLALEHGDTPPAGEPAALARLARDLTQRVCAAAGTTPDLGGAGVPGVRDADGVTLRYAVNLPRLEGSDLRRLFADATGCPIVIESDANAAALGQWRAHAQRPARFVYLALGTGVGGGVVLDGGIVRHTNGGPGHFGFLLVDTGPEALRGRNGNAGNLSAYASGSALAEHGNLELAARRLAIGIAQIAHIYMPDVVALAGGAVERSPELIEATRRRFEPLRTRIVERTRIEAAPLAAARAGVIGAAQLALQAGRRAS